MNTQKRIPYGISNFEALINEGYVYVDKTRYIEALENEGNPYQIFIRPRKFGKSLFFTTLSCYYDRNYAEKFAALFKGLYIGEHPTPKRNSFMMLRFDFSGIDTSSAQDFASSFYEKIREALLDCMETYQHLFPDVLDKIERIKQLTHSTGALQTVFGAVKAADAQLFVIIDEYDHFANDLIALGKLGDDVYHRMVNANGLVRDFYETLKDGTKSVVSRIFITGISPVMMNDLTSGFNIASNITLNRRYNEMMGFTHQEVDALIDTMEIDRKFITVDLERYYNGYLFHKDAENRVYNPTMALYCLYQIQTEQRPPEQLFDENLRTDYARLRRLTQNDNNRKTLVDIMKNGGITAEIASRFSMDEMYNDQYFVSLLFYMGLLTIDHVELGSMVLKIPNYSIKTLYWEYLEQLTRDLNTDVIIDLREESATIKALAKGDPTPYIAHISKNIFKRLSNRDLIGFDEKYIKLILLNGLYRSRLYEPSSEMEVEGGYIDIYLPRSPRMPEVPYEWVWELKYLKKGDAKKAEATFTAAKEQLKRYRQSALLRDHSDMKYAALLFIGKDQYRVEVVP